MIKTLYMLIGPKGAGKSHIGRIVAAHTDIAFIEAESIWLSVRPGEDGWQAVTRAVDECFETRSRVMIESLGAGEQFHAFHANLAARYAIRMIRVTAQPETCLERVRRRDQHAHIAVPLEKVAQYNAIASCVTWPWSAEIDNEGPATVADVLETICRV